MLGDTNTLGDMVGHDDTKKAYRLYNPNNSSVMISASGWFVRTTFPFRQEGFGKVPQLMHKAIGVTPAVLGAMGDFSNRSKMPMIAPRNNRITWFQMLKS